MTASISAGPTGCVPHSSPDRAARAGAGRARAAPRRGRRAREGERPRTPAGRGSQTWKTVEPGPDIRRGEPVADNVDPALDDHEADHPEGGEPGQKTHDDEHRQDDLRPCAREGHRPVEKSELAGVVAHRLEGAREDGDIGAGRGLDEADKPVAKLLEPRVDVVGKERGGEDQPRGGGQHGSRGGVESCVGGGSGHLWSPVFVRAPPCRIRPRVVSRSKASGTPSTSSAPPRLAPRPRAARNAAPPSGRAAGSGSKPGRETSTSSAAICGFGAPGEVL